MSTTTFPPRPAVFLDRDGTLNAECNYLHRREGWQWLPGVPGALAALARGGFRLVVVTNQSGIARGYYTQADVDRLHAWVRQDLRQRNGTSIDAFYCCPHHPDHTGPCVCRKPAPGMLLAAARELHLDLARSWMVGDKADDIRAGNAAGCSSILLLTGYGAQDRPDIEAEAAAVLPGLRAAAAHILHAAR